MKQIILKRHYLIKDRSERILVEHSPTFLQGKVVVLKKYTQQQIDKIVRSALPLLEKIAEKDMMMKEFWSLATDQLKHDLAISYYSHQHQRQKKVLNVETIDWKSMTVFQVKYQHLLAQRLSIFHPVQAVKAIIRTMGKHHDNLRFHNIHLATDFINQQHIHQIHWDIETPINPKRSLKHFIIDDFLG